MPAVLLTFDAVRRRLLRGFAPWLGKLYGSREKRVAWFGSLSVLIALLLSLRFPLALFALGPLLLGVPHLLSDVRYLVVQPKAHKRPLIALFVLVPLAATWVSPTLKVGMLSVVGAALIARTTWFRKVLGITVASGLYVAALLAPSSFALLFAHGHNFIAAIILLCFSRSVRHAILPVLLFCAISLLTMGGAFDAFTLDAARSALPGGASLGVAIWQYAPFCRTETMAARLVVLFVFAQSVHYTIWLRLLPDEARPRKGLRSFQQTYVAIRNDVGSLALLVFAIAAVFFVVWGMRSLEPARLGYLRIAAFHGYLELSFLMLLALEGRTRGDAWVPRRYDAHEGAARNGEDR